LCGIGGGNEYHRPKSSNALELIAIISASQYLEEQGEEQYINARNASIIFIISEFNNQTSLTFLYLTHIPWAQPAMKATFSNISTKSHPVKMPKVMILLLLLPFAFHALAAPINSDAIPSSIVAAAPSATLLARASPGSGSNPNLCDDGTKSSGGANGLRRRGNCFSKQDNYRDDGHAGGNRQEEFDEYEMDRYGERRPTRNARKRKNDEVYGTNVRGTKATPEEYGQDLRNRRKANRGDDDLFRSGAGVGTPKQAKASGAYDDNITRVSDSPPTMSWEEQEALQRSRKSDRRHRSAQKNKNKNNRGGASSRGNRDRSRSRDRGHGRSKGKGKGRAGPSSGVLQDD